MKVTLFRPRKSDGKKGFYYVKWKPAGGKERRKSLEVTDLATARKIRDEMQRQLASERFGILDEIDYTPADAWKEYERLVSKPEPLLRHEKGYWDQFWNDTGVPTLRSVRRGDIAMWQKHLIEKKKNEPITVNTKCRQVAAVFSCLIREQVYDGPNPFVGRKVLDEGRRKVRFIPWETVEAVLDRAKEVNTDLYLVVVLGVLQGLRHGEILAARWEHINWKKGEFDITGTKTAGSSDTLPLHEVIRERLEPYKQKSGWIVKPDKEPGAHAYRWEFRKQWEALRDEMKLPSARIHDLRHSFACRLLDLGYPMAVIAKMMRHTSTRMTERYADLRTVKVQIGRIDSQKGATP